jgi:protein phosphatase
VRFKYARRASQGARSYQEDAAAVEPGPAASRVEPSGGQGDVGALTAVLADGMGGHAGGALASDTACRTFLAAFAAGPGEIRVRLDRAMRAANAAIAEQVTLNPTLSGMGCTLIGSVFGAPGIEWISVGDSPLFLVRDAEIALLNEDHSLAPEIDKLAASGRISWDAARNDPRRHFLRSALTGGDIDLVDCSRRPLVLQAGDTVVLASDGIHTLAPHEILRLVAACRAAGPAAIADALIGAVDDAGEEYQDNTTVIVVTAS